MAGAPDMSRVHRTIRCSKEGTAPELASLGNSRGLLRYNSPDMSGVHPPLIWGIGLSVYTGQCPVHQRTPTQTCHLREFPEALRYNSPDCRLQRSQAQRSTPTVLCNVNSARTVRVELEQAPEGAPDSEQYLSGAAPDCSVDPAVRAPTVEPNGRLT